MWRVKHNNNSKKVVTVKNINNETADFVKDEREMPGKQRGTLAGLQMNGPGCDSALECQPCLSAGILEQIQYLRGDCGLSVPSPGQSQLWRDRLWDAYSEKSMLKCLTLGTKTAGYISS